ncbi:MAG: hypothetical protein ACRC5D_08055 [Aeromonas allosaccharophila]
MRKDAVQPDAVRLTSREVDQLVNYFELLEEKEAALNDEMALVKAKIGAALRAENGELHPGEYALKGAAYTLDVQVGEVWSWDSAKLMQLAEVYPSKHLKVSARIDKVKFQQLPDELQLKYHDALTVKTGKIKYTVRGA